MSFQPPNVSTILFDAEPAAINPFAPHFDDRAIAFGQSQSPGLYRAVGKRAFDIALVLLAAPVVLPVMLLLSLGVALGGGKIFYSQLRVGQHGRNFRMWKLRSMIENADAHLDAYLAANPAAREEWHVTQKLKNDPRITRVGKLLRKTSLDELPQLWNVLTGDMSLVGPRPMMVNQKSLYPGQAYYRLRPGITGPWQVSARNDCTFAGRANYDAEYDRALSCTLDFGLLVKTVSVVLRATGR